MKKQKRYYKIGEVVFCKESKLTGKIKAIDLENYEVKVDVSRKDEDSKIETLKLWEITKYVKRPPSNKHVPVGLNKPFFEVRDFHKAFGHPVANTPTRLSAERALEREGWMREEVDEFLNALTVTDQADAMIDLIYFALGTLVEMGVRPNRLFEIVHNANMSKLWEDGKPRYRESDGKVIKPEGWQSPEPLIEKEIIRQSNITT